MKLVIGTFGNKYYEREESDFIANNPHFASLWQWIVANHPSYITKAEQWFDTGGYKEWDRDGTAYRASPGWLGKNVFSTLCLEMKLIVMIRVCDFKVAWRRAGGLESAP